MATSANGEIDLDFTLGLSELYRANVAIAQAKLGILRFVVWGIVILVGAVPVLVFFVKMSGKPVEGSIGNFWGFVIPLAFWIYALRLGPYLAARSWLKNSPNAGKPTRYTFSDSSIFVESTTGKTDLRWTGVIRVRELREFFLLYVQKKLA